MQKCTDLTRANGMDEEDEDDGEEEDEAIF